MTRGRAVAVTVCVAATLAGCGATHPSHRQGRSSSDRTPTGSTTRGDTNAAAPHPDLGPFAGYVWNGDVQSDHADWTVPRLLPSSARGEAATWIGAEAPGPTRGAPFIQVGVNEGDTGGAPFYYAFYSTTQLRFHPVKLFDVSPGDQISATLRRLGARWQIELIDRSIGRQRQLSVAEGAGREFNEAQYTQEDVTDARTRRPFPYPSLSPIRFTALAANGVAPRPARLTSNWLTETDGYLAPGPLQGGGFALVHARLTASGLRYLHAIAAQDTATATAIAQLLSWAQGGRARPARFAARALAKVLTATVKTLDNGRWPAAARPAVSVLRAGDRALIALLSTLKTMPITRRFAWTERLDQLANTVGADGQRARRALRLPSPWTVHAAD